MSAKFLKKQLIIIALLLDEEERKSERRFWIHPMLLQRQFDGEFFTLHKKLLDDETKFYKCYRMSISQFEWLHGEIHSSILKKDTNIRKAISTKHKLAVCLRFLATGDSFQTIAFSYRLGHSTVSRVVKDVCIAIIKHLMPLVIPTPTKSRWQTIQQEFWDLWDFPNCIGAIDGKHVVITAPHNTGSLFFNYKKTFSVVLLALVDAKYNFITIDVGSYGKNSDGGIFFNSALGKSLEANNLDVPSNKFLPGSSIEAPHVVVGDEAFPLKPYLLRPYPGNQVHQDEARRHFNERLSRARRTVENAFGILSQKFQIYNRRIKSQPQHVDNIILTTCVLHNYIRSDTNNFASDNSSGRIPQGEFQNIPRQGGNASSAAFETRNVFKDYLCSPQGRLQWQNK